MTVICDKFLDITCFKMTVINGLDVLAVIRITGLVFWPTVYMGD